ncbi:hypothetical protein [Paenibacillus sp. GYB003]|uniref:hypothetical protein n=1 Tax=Paenibacillus sp. GYB003 TaxID=2994392 RepID=UPI002F9612E3
MIATPNITNRLNEAMEQARETIELLQKKQNAEGITVLSAKQLSAALKIGRAEAKARIDRLIDFGLVRKTGFNGYKLIRTDLDVTPFGTALELARVISELPNATYEEQASALGMTNKELEAAYGLLVYLLRA